VPLDDIALVQDEDEVGFLYRRQTVCDNERCLVGEQTVATSLTSMVTAPEFGSYGCIVVRS
jgi:hypothetical protein